MTHQHVSFFQKYIFPIERQERQKFYYFAVLAFLISVGNLNLTGLRDSLVITAPNSSATILVYLRCFGSLPIGILFVMFFSWMIDRFSRRSIFNVFFLSTSAFLLFFPFFLYPSIERYQPSPQYIENLIQSYPHWKWFIVIYGNWLICIYYLIVDLWLGASFTVLFWQLANQVVTTHEAKRFYPVFIAIGGLASIASGMGVVKLVNMVLASPSDQGQVWTHVFQLVSVLSVVSFLIAVSIHIILWERPFMLKHKTPPKDRSKTSIFQGFHYLFNSKYLRCIFLILLSNEMIYEFTALLWKTELNKIETSPDNYNYFLSQVRIWEGIGVAIIAYISKTFIPQLGWKFVAYMAPLLTGLSATVFLSALLLNGHFPEFSQLSSLIIYIGTANTIIISLVYYAFVYTTKEMAYIPLPTDMKVKGKAAVDVLSFDIANGGSAGTDAILTAYFAAGLLITLPYASVFVFILLGIWFYSVRTLAPLYEELIKVEGNEKSMN
ncbi:NTP/NDP exchange transporter [Candidatus Bealeia paramacronuclearis]|uniref:ADP,ATP carrier protein n=1 Tax=Candidatus Bealeia paramacronuclearis TaxID=1921001 RepID=A0ABZ2C4G0_9PROT|nr:NTP/NDP exchange transporter [Candidatus Bealeia paramacronuclearis]